MKKVELWFAVFLVLFLVVLTARTASAGPFNQSGQETRFATNADGDKELVGAARRCMPCKSLKGEERRNEHRFLKWWYYTHSQEDEPTLIGGGSESKPEYHRNEHRWLWWWRQTRM